MESSSLRTFFCPLVLSRKMGTGALWDRLKNPVTDIRLLLGEARAARSCASPLETTGVEAAASC